MRIDFTDTDESTFEPLPPGEYRLQISNMTETETSENSKNPGEPMIKVELTVSDGQYENRKLFDNLLPTIPSIKGRVMNFLNALGEDTEGELEVDWDDYVGEEVIARVATKKATAEYDEGNRVTKYKPVPSDVAAMP